MCLATPVKVLKLNNNLATVDALGEEREVDTSLLPNVKIGDYLYFSHGMAIRKVDKAEAEKVLELVRNWHD
jgi:hydrogenase expression/formation protein HypC